MGLDTSHDAFHGSYSSFGFLRQFVCMATGGSYPLHHDPDLDPGFWYFGEGFSAETHPGLTEFLSHSDYDGEMSPAQCTLVANELEALLPAFRRIVPTKELPFYLVLLRQFIAGCRRAAAANEPLIFA